MNAMTPLLAAAGLLDTWSVREIAGLVTTGVLILVLWLLFRKLKFPE